MLEINSRISIPDEELSWEYARSGGPGGQNVNKVSSKAVLRWHPASSPSLPPAVKARLLAAVKSKLTVEGELLITSQRSRDRERNVQDCLEKLRLVILAAATPPKRRVATKPTVSSQRERVESKRKRSVAKQQRRSSPSSDDD